MRLLRIVTAIVAVFAIAAAGFAPQLSEADAFAFSQSSSHDPPCDQHGPLHGCGGALNDSCCAAGCASAGFVAAPSVFGCRPLQGPFFSVAFRVSAAASPSVLERPPKRGDIA